MEATLLGPPSRTDALTKEETESLRHAATGVDEMRIHVRMEGEEYFNIIVNKQQCVSEIKSLLAQHEHFKEILVGVPHSRIVCYMEKVPKASERERTRLDPRSLLQADDYITVVKTVLEEKRQTPTHRLDQSRPFASSEGSMSSVEKERMNTSSREKSKEKVGLSSPTIVTTSPAKPVKRRSDSVGVRLFVDSPEKDGEITHSPTATATASGSASASASATASTTASGSAGASSGTTAVAVSLPGSNSDKLDDGESNEKSILFISEPDIFTSTTPTCDRDRKRTRLKKNSFMAKERRLEPRTTTTDGMMRSSSSDTLDLCASHQDERSQRIMELLKELNLTEYYPAFQAQHSVVRSSKDGSGTISEQIDPQPIPIEAQMFAPNPEAKKDKLQLMKADKTKVLHLLFLDKSDPFGKIFSQITFFRTFMLTFPSFMSRGELLNYLQESFFKTSNNLQKQRILSFASEWRHFEDGSDFSSEKMKEAWSSFSSQILTATASNVELYSIAEILISDNTTIPSLELDLKPAKSSPNLLNPKSLSMGELDVSSLLPPSPRSAGEMTKNLASTSSSDTIPSYTTRISTSRSSTSRASTITSESSNKRTRTTKQKKFNSGNLYNIEPPELAHQITVLIEKPYRQLKRREFLKKNCEPTKREKKAQNVKKLLDIQELLKNIIQSQILSHARPKEQIFVWKYFFHVAKRLMEINNFFGLEAVISGLNSAAVSKLKAIQQTIKSDPEIDNLWQNILQFNDPLNLKSYNEVKASVTAHKPMIPRLSVGNAMVELAKTEEIHSTIVEDPTSKQKTWINWKKLHVISKCITNLMRVSWKGESAPSYPYRENPEIIKTLMAMDSSWKFETANCYIAMLRNGKSEWEKYPLETIEIDVEEEEEADADDYEEDEKELIGYCNTLTMGGNNLNEMYDRDWKIIYTATSPTVLKYTEDDISKATGNEIVVQDPKLKEDAAFIFRLVEGQVVIADGSSEKPYILRAPNTFGLMSLLRPKSQFTGAKFVVRKPATLFKIDIAKLTPLLIEDPTISRKLFFSIAWKYARRIKRILGHNSLMRTSCDVPIDDTLHYPTLYDTKTKQLQKDYALPEDSIILRSYKVRTKWTKLSETTTRLYVTNNYLCFSRRRVPTKIEISKIKEIVYSSKSNVVRIVPKECSKFSIKHFFNAEMKVAYSFLRLLWEGAKETENSCPASTLNNLSTGTGSSSKLERKYTLPAQTSRESSKETTEDFNLNEEDWKIIYKGSKRVNFTNTDSIVDEGSDNRSLYRIICGSFRVRMGNKIFTLSEGDMFGEIIHLTTNVGITSYEVTVAEPNSSVYVIDAYFLAVLFQHYPSLAGKFYYSQASSLCATLNSIQVGYI